MIAFWVLAPVMVAAALGLLFARKAVHAALLLAVVMISLAVLYAVQDAPFLFAVQIIVYTGAILMLFLFVLMLVGVDASDSVVETIKGQRLAAAIVGLLFGAILVLGVVQISVGAVTGLDVANEDGNVPGLAQLLFSKYVFAFEATSALLITAAVGAMVLAHRERITPRRSQADLAAQRMRDYAQHGKPLGPLPSPGVFARHNAVDTPALLPDGTPAESSVSRVLSIRGTIRSAADLDIPMVAVSLLHRHGYFFQHLDAAGNQTEEPVSWAVEDYAEALEARACVEVEGRTVHLRAWRHLVKGISGSTVPVYFLDADLPQNAAEDRRLTDVLYGGDAYYRLCQEVILGIGGIRMLASLGYQGLYRYHLNEGHAALLVLGLLEQRMAEGSQPQMSCKAALEAVREHCVFTTHTPVPAGHDQFPADLARRVLGERFWALLSECWNNAPLNMTELALRCARYINGVAMKHGEVSRGLFPGYPIHSITNGVHASTWAAPPFQRLYDRHLPDWRRDFLSLRYAVGIPTAELWQAHQEAKRALLDTVNRVTNAGMNCDALTIGFARRATAYKRFLLLFHDLDRLVGIVKQTGPLQIIFAGKAHPRDHEGKAIIRRVHEVKERLRDMLFSTLSPCTTASALEEPPLSFSTR